ncbi:ArsR/SmtB family transcription factor [Cohnella nanjingensis]|uniref:ArsR family transcriptional regulator n=1 Tax=Cohnella nanjingensis TaxID=1387779 RepID=A0A7X0VEA5_9BACL|nr:ArsR family transcriptional regulator [Cohnella nanjingensis]MBB6670526.1 ArsR family transcriptional regulator [Cohnella nanjingensis]
MNLDISDKSLPVYEALASSVRLKVIRLLARQSMNIRELSEAVGLSSAIMTMHIKKLEKAGIVHSEMQPSRGGMQKVCSLQVEEAEIIFPNKLEHIREYHQSEISVGHFTDFDVEPTCGLATTDRFIGIVDDPRSFLAPERFQAKILWFSEGFIEYKIPNFLLSTEHPKELVISMEIASEAPLTNNNWPSDITFYLNHVKLGTWTSPGDYGDKRGKYNPAWWPDDINQYGLLKHLTVTNQGTRMDGNAISDVTLDQVNIWDKQWTLRIAMESGSRNVGGVTLFGSGFGNYRQDILFRLYYEKTVPVGIPELAEEEDAGASHVDQGSSERKPDAEER